MLIRSIYCIFQTENPSHNLQNLDSNLFSQKLSILHLVFFSENLQRTRALVLCAIIYQHFWSFCKHNFAAVEPFSSTVTSSSSMVVELLSWNQSDWTFNTPPFIIWNLKVLLFRLGKAGKPRNQHISSNQVNLRTLLIVKSWYAYYRSFHAGCNQLRIEKYCWVLREKYWFEVCWSNVILLDSPILAWIRIIECWIVNVHAETNTVIYRLLIFVKVRSWLGNLGEHWRTRLEP